MPSALPIEVSISTTTPMDSRRNRLAGRLANWALALATPEYRKFVGGAILYGMNAAARDVVEGDEPPPSWYAA